MAADQAEYAQEEKTVGDEKVVIEVAYAKEFLAGEVADHAGQHEQGAENAGSPAEITDDCR